MQADNYGCVGIAPIIAAKEYKLMKEGKKLEIPDYKDPKYEESMFFNQPNCIKVLSQRRAVVRKCWGGIKSSDISIDEKKSLQKKIVPHLKIDTHPERNVPEPMYHGYFQDKVLSAAISCINKKDAIDVTK